VIIKGVDTELNRSLVGDINPIKKDIKIDKNITNKKVALEIYSIPSSKLTFRKYSFPIKKTDYLEKTLKTQLELDLPINLKEIEYRYITKQSENKLDIFCVITKKDEIKNFPENSVVDTEIFSLIRVAKFNGITEGIIYHFTNSYILKLRFNDSFPEEVRVIDSVSSIEEDAYISGNIKGYSFNNKVLNNPTGEPFNNVAFGLLIKPLYDIGVDFLKKNDTDFIKSNIKALTYLTLSLIILNLVFFINLQIKNYELKKIKNKQKEIFYKYWKKSGRIYSPLLQAKGILKNLKTKGRSKLDGIYILEQIGKSVKSSGVESIKKVHISSNRVLMEGIATNEIQFKEFKRVLARNFSIENEETYLQQSGKLKFKIEAKYE